MLCGFALGLTNLGIYEISEASATLFQLNKSLFTLQVLRRATTRIGDQVQKSHKNL